MRGPWALGPQGPGVLLDPWGPFGPLGPQGPGVLLDPWGPKALGCFWTPGVLLDPCRGPGALWTPEKY